MENVHPMKLRPRRRSQKPTSAETGVAATGFPWRRLPPEMQGIIWKHLADDGDGGTARSGESRAQYAAVGLHWQSFFEGIIFSKLVLHDSDLAAFEKIIKRRTANGKSGRYWLRGKPASPMPRIQHIWLRVELYAYKCDWCQRPPNHIEAHRNNVQFTRSLWKLLDILSTWEKRDANHGQQLTLELSAHSPSDSQHLLRSDAEHQDAYPYRAGIDAQRRFIEGHVSAVLRPTSPLTRIQSPDQNHDHNLPWGPYTRSTGQYYLPTLPNLNRISAWRLISDLKFDSIPYKRGQGARLPEVKMVSSFLMRRQYHRSFYDIALRRLVKDSLPGLRSMRCERWRTPDPDSQVGDDWRLSLAMNPSGFGQETILGSTKLSPLETLSMFEDFSVKMHGKIGRRDPRPSTTKILQWVANSAVNIRNVSVAFLSDAKDCLQLGTATLPNLESLALTSQHWLEPTQQHTEALLKLAARAALNMPKLQILEIWACSRRGAAIFRYEATATAETSACRITWRCSWRPPRRPIDWHGVEGVLAAWRHVAATNADRQLIFREEPLPRGARRYTKYGAILHLLKLRNLILDPTSVMQVRMGTGWEDEPEVEAWEASRPDSHWCELSKRLDSKNTDTHAGKSL